MQPVCLSPQNPGLEMSFQDRNHSSAERYSTVYLLGRCLPCPNLLPPFLPPGSYPLTGPLQLTRLFFHARYFFKSIIFWHKLSLSNSAAFHSFDSGLAIWQQAVDLLPLPVMTNFTPIN